MWLIVDQAAFVYSSSLSSGQAFSYAGVHPLFPLFFIRATLCLKTLWSPSDQRQLSGEHTSSYTRSDTATKHMHMCRFIDVPPLCCFTAGLSAHVAVNRRISLASAENDPFAWSNGISVVCCWCVFYCMCWFPFCYSSFDAVEQRVTVTMWLKVVGL